MSSRGVAADSTEDVAISVYHRATEDFVRAYNREARLILELKRTDNGAAADRHVALGTLVAQYAACYDRFIVDQTDRQFLRSEVVARCMQALSLRSMQLSGFADLAVSLGTVRNIHADIERARRRLDDARDSDAAAGDDSADDGDPRTRTDGLYEYIAHESLKVSLNDLPEDQHAQLLTAYFVISGSNGAVTAGDDDDVAAAKRASARAGANVILYGPPGTGKTAAARAIARSLGLDLAFVNAENLLSAHRSETEKNLRALYRKMRALVRVTGRNVVMLLDEVDGLVKNRSNASVTSGEYSLLTRFLMILEPNDSTDNYGMFSIFTTNRLSNLDDAFRRRCATVFMAT
ncbi:fidgetin-like protein 1 [Harpegnathos saltator]|uniref:fidgetin-like protein 1 n=1 Tax=Harpegnathos saltator TaxID=610380 RepID=UPI000DBEECC3|nr:fidgetin-like protein 1 [Harpegnathos saltator]